MWWSNNDANWADYRLEHDFDLTGAAAPIFTFYTDYTIEELWDYAFVEVSDDSGASWVQLPDMDGITTNDDPNGRLIDYGGLQNGITGDSGGWIQMRFDLTAYAGSSNCAYAMPPMPPSLNEACSSMMSRLMRLVMPMTSRVVMEVG